MSGNIFYFERKKLLGVVRKKIFKTKILLDIGSGIRPQTLFIPKTHICCEPYKEYIDFLIQRNEKIKDREWVVLNVDWDEAMDIFPENSVDSIIISDVIEHIEKEKGKLLLSKAVKVARYQLALFTPIGFLPQYHPDGKDAWGMNGGTYQEHKSGWEFEDFSDSWEIYASKIFHTHDNSGNLFKNPYGAMWCIYNKKNYKRFFV